MSAQRDIRIEVPVLARVEGEGALELVARDGHIDELRLRIFEPPRYFEKFLEGRSYTEVLDTVARICGICPVAYQMSAVQALEQIFGVEVAPEVVALRRLMYCGEWLQSHALHIHLLALPDFLGFDNGIALAGQHPEAVRRGLRLQRLGNDLIKLFGGRSVHPVGLAVGGFHRAPDRSRAADLLDELRAALPAALELISFTGSLGLPADDQDFTSVSLRQAGEYPMYHGHLISDQGLDIPIESFLDYFEETHVAHSTALYAYMQGKPYLVGPLARLNLNLDQLSAPARKALEATGVAFPSRNMFHSIIARAVEIHEAILEAIRLLEDYTRRTTPLEPARMPVHVRAGVGYGATEAPRGLLWHRYTVDEQGLIQAAQIVPPTAQNQARIEDDLRQSLQNFGLHHPDDALRLRGETVIRNYDPCISCATHFLRVHVERIDSTQSTCELQ